MRFKIARTLFLSSVISLFPDKEIFGQSIDTFPEIASEYFREAKFISDRDKGKLWGTNLYGPMIFVDKNTGKAIANEIDSAGQFTKRGNVFVGTVPRSFGSNTAREWGGKIWTFILWPLPTDKLAREQLMMHELFHQYQKKKKLPEFSPVCDHLEEMEARILLKLELEALREAINDYPKYSKSDLTNALAMRLYRYQKFPKADSLEHALEINEGLATYTEFIITQPDLRQAKEVINDRLDAFFKNETFVRSLGYVTGYLYGFLLFKADPRWNKKLNELINTKNDVDFRTLKESVGFDIQLLKQYNLVIPANLSETYNSILAKNKYNFNTISIYEGERENKRLAIASENRRKFVDGPVLILPNEKMSFNFNPNEVQVLDGYGPVYPTFYAKAEWGLLEVIAGGVLIKDWMFVYLPLPQTFDSKERTISTPGWKLELKEGWIITEGDRKGDFKVVKQ